MPDAAARDSGVLWGREGAVTRRLEMNPHVLSAPQAKYLQSCPCYQLEA